MNADKIWEDRICEGKIARHNSKDFKRECTILMKNPFIFFFVILAFFLESFSNKYRSKTLLYWNNQIFHI